MKLKRKIKFGLKYLIGYKIQGIGINLTRRCDLSCPYCKIKDNSSKEDEISVDQWKKIINKFRKFKHSHFIFTGGEPLLYEGIFDLIDYTSKSSLTSLITNTNQLNKKNFHKLKSLDFLTFSCDTTIENGSFEKNSLDKLNLIQHMSKKLNIKTSTIITITSKNIKEVPKIIKNLKDYEISILLSLIHSSKEKKYEFRSYVPELEFKTNEEIKDLENLVKKIKKMKKKGYKIAENQDYLNNIVSYAKGKYKIKCPATNPFFTIDYDGYIKPCHDIPASKINALEFKNYKKMKEQVASKIPKKCNCFYDCYFNNQIKIKNIINQFFNR